MEKELNAGICSPHCAMVTSVYPNLALLLSQLLAPDASVIPMCQSMRRTKSNHGMSCGRANLNSNPNNQQQQQQCTYIINRLLS